MATTLGQRCTVYLDSTGVQRFKIESSVDIVLAGDLPSANVFVHQVIAANDPKADKFLRVGNVADLTTLPQGRDAAVASVQVLYLSTEFTTTYDDIATASAAKKLIQQRVDNLITDWRAYNASFLAPVSVPPNQSNISLPLTLTFEDELKSTYSTAHAELLVAQAASAAAATAVATTATAASTANTTVATTTTDSQQCNTLLGQYNTGKAAVDAYRTGMSGGVNNFVTAAQTFDTASHTYSLAVTAFREAAAAYRAGGSAGTFDTATTVFTTATTAWATTALSAFDSSITTAQTIVAAEALTGAPILSALQTSMASACTAKLSAVSTASTAKTAADLAAATAVTEKKAADEVTSTALVADATALLAVQLVCPDFVPITP